MAEAGATAEFLLEIGCEEIPAGWLPDLRGQMRDRFRELAEAAFLAPAAVESHSTARRLVVRADVRVRQADRAEEVWGPALKAARDAAGAWTPAALGFARKNGVAPEDLEAAAKDPRKPEELSLRHLRRVAGQEAAAVLPGVVAGLLRALAFPKRMSWDAWLDDGKGSLPFGRPIRWLVCLLGGEVVPFTIHELVGGVKGEPKVTSGDTTFGHRFLPRGHAGQGLRVTSFAQLTGLLRDHFVLLDVEERKKRVHGFVSRLKVNGGKGLEREWVELAEYPTVVTGLFPEHFKQTLPIDLRATVLQHHQKYMSVGKAGFAALTDIDEPAAARAVRGMERVVLARFRDAAFFLAEDQRRRLEDRVADLKEVTYHQKLGSYHDKMERMVRQVASMGDHGWLQGADRDSAHRAARLAKADLTTLMVGEFPELQGTMGAFYLGEQQEGQDGPKEPAEVLRAIRFHWGPAGVRAEDAPPRSDVGRGPVFGSVALADKLDTLAGYFLLGLEPRGSSDPFGLRRAGQGIVRVLLDYWPGPPAVDLGALVPVALEGYAGLAPGRGKDGTLSPEEAARALSAFLEARLAYVLTARECPNDVVDAVLRAPGRPPLRDLKGCWDRAEALKRVRAEAPEDFAALAQAFKRASNILDGQAPASTVDEALFEAPAERALLAAVQKRAGREGSHEERLRALAGLRGPVAGFFDDVLVMAEDPAVRGNRLALLARARDLFFDIADVSRLGG